MPTYERLKDYSDYEFIKLRKRLQFQRYISLLPGMSIGLLVIVVSCAYANKPAWQYWATGSLFVALNLVLFYQLGRLRRSKGPGVAEDLLESKEGWRAVYHLVSSSAGAREVHAYAQEVRGRRLYGIDLVEMRRRRDVEEAEQQSKTSEALRVPDIAPGAPNPFSTGAQPCYLEYAGKSDAQLEELAKSDLKAYRRRMCFWAASCVTLAVGMFLAVHLFGPAPDWYEQKLLEMFATLWYLGCFLVMTGFLVHAWVGKDSQFGPILDPDAELSEVKAVLEHSPGARAVRNAAAHAGRKLHRFDLHEMRHQREHEELETLRNPPARRQE